MARYLRLRQICLVAPQLEPVISDISAIMGLSVCYRDGNVAKYGLENALLPVDTILLEVVAPTQPGTAAGRFLDKRSEEHTSELQSQFHLVCRLLLEKKKNRHQSTRDS